MPLQERVAQPSRATETVTRPEPYKPSRASIWRIRLTGIGGFLLFLVAWRLGQTYSQAWIFPLGLICALSGLLVRIWATGWLVKNDKLTTSGPYRLTRNPLYLGTLLIVLGQCLMSGVIWAPLVFLPFFLILFWQTMLQEEKFLSGVYGEDYVNYARSVPLLFPRLQNLSRSSIASPEQSFAWPRVLRCYKGFTANLLLICIYAWLYLSRLPSP